jgi:hypothetical protein
MEKVGDNDLNKDLNGAGLADKGLDGINECNFSENELSEILSTYSHNEYVTEDNLKRGYLRLTKAQAKKQSEWSKTANSPTNDLSEFANSPNTVILHEISISALSDEQRLDRSLFFEALRVVSRKQNKA